MRGKGLRPGRVLEGASSGVDQSPEPQAAPECLSHLVHDAASVGRDRDVVIVGARHGWRTRGHGHDHPRHRLRRLRPEGPPGEARDDGQRESCNPRERLPPSGWLHNCCARCCANCRRILRRTAKLNPCVPQCRAGDPWVPFRDSDAELGKRCWDVRRSAGHSGSFIMTAASVSDTSRPRNGRCAVSISNSTAPKRPNVCPLVNRFAPCLLRRHVRRRAHDHAHLGRGSRERG